MGTATYGKCRTCWHQWQLYKIHEVKSNMDPVRPAPALSPFSVLSLGARLPSHRSR
jgi:hypothetical protein